MNRLFALFFFAIGLTMVGQVPNGVPTEGLVAWWDFNPSNIDQAEVFENGILTSNRFGQPDRAIEFLGGGNCQSTCDGITFAGDTAVNNSFAFATWVRPTRSVTVRPESSLCYPSVSVPMANSNQNWVLIPANGGSGALGVGLSVGTNGIFVGEHATNLLVSRLSHPIAINDFVHVVVVYESTSAKLYVNGELVRSRTMHCGGVPKVLTAEAGDNPYWPILLAPGLYSPRFQGVIDDYAFWNRPLTPEEVLQLYNAQDVLGCTDPMACNYSEDATVNDGSCVLPGEQGSSCDDGDAGTFNDVYLSDGCTCAGTDYVNPDGTGPCAASEFVSYKGYDYRLVEVGSQCWFQENVRELPSVSPWSEGYEDDGLAHAYVNGYMGSDTLEAQQTSAYETFGALYNFAAVEQWNLCPSGFHVPELSNFYQIINEFGNAAGGMMKEVGTTLEGATWLSPNGGATNALGFEAKAGGHRLPDQSFAWQGYYAYFWASSSTPLYSRLDWDHPGMFSDGYSHPIGMSVRCVKGIPGCTNAGACNYDAGATLDDGSCILPDLCGVCGGDNTSCVGCTDDQACNYDSEALIDEGCIYPLFDGDCLAGAQACGEGQVWNAELQVCVTISLFDSNFDGCVTNSDLLDFLAAYGLCLDPIQSFQTCGDPLPYQGYDYETIQIGDQCWLAENLQSTHYTNGDSIPNYVSGSEWLSANQTETGAWCDFGNNPSYGELYGKLYNWYVVGDDRGICPTGWHVPSTSEWNELVGLFGGSAAAAPDLKANHSDQWFGTGLSGFEALPGGFRDWGNAVFFAESTRGNWWTSSTQGSAFWRGMHHDSDAVSGALFNKRMGNSIRCVMD